jgi:hypothetical protein
MSRKVSNHVQNSQDWVSPVVVTPGNEVHSKFSKFSTVSWRFCTAEEPNVEDIVVLDSGLTWCTHCPVSRRKCASRWQTSRLTKSKLSLPVSGLTSRLSSYLCFCCCVYNQVVLGSWIQKGKPTSLWWCNLCSWCVVPVLVAVSSEGQQRCQTDFTVMTGVLCFSDVFVYMLWYPIGGRKESIWFHFGGFLYSLNSLMFLGLCCVRLGLLMGVQAWWMTSESNHVIRSARRSCPFFVRLRSERSWISSRKLGRQWWKRRDDSCICGEILFLWGVWEEDRVGVALAFWVCLLLFR